MTRAIAAAICAGLGLASAGCGDNTKACAGPDCPDAQPQFDASTSPDARAASDFTSFVRDQIVNHTDDSGLAVPFGLFAPGVIPDNDLDDVDYSAYADLF
jgi:hypothetical protein